MPGIAQRINTSNTDNSDNYQNSLVRNGAASFSGSNGLSISTGDANGFWSKHRDDVSYNQLQKFWSELTPLARQELLRIDKQTLFEQARKNMYCSRCNGLLLEGFLQIVMYGKSLQQDVAGGQHSVRVMKNQIEADLRMTNGCSDEIQDPSVHPWGGLTTTKDGALTLLDCYRYSKSLKGVQNVFDSARARERERELLYPDACGGGGRGWISQGLAGYGRGHGTRETCALHTARLSVDTLVDFWSALGEETRQSLLRMKEEDFIERLMYRFDSKRFCRDCRRNVIREFKELKELKRMRREPRCTTWFCVADTAFQYEVTHDSVHADWQQIFMDACGAYHHFEWAIGTGEGKSDILEFENVGLSGRVQVKGLDLSGLSACYITVRAWKTDGRCNELSVKAHALRGQQCVHCRLVVGEGYVTITRGESVRRFFEHAEEAEEEEDDDSMDKDGNELDGECSRPQKHAKSPELAREFLLDAATVIFKEQVEKAFREGTARQNAHSIFVCLALKLLEERVHVACKEIITLEKQMKLLEEEEKEKREEEERKERRRTKEREKKLRRKERLREKENKEKKNAESDQHPLLPDVSKEESATSVDEDANMVNSRDSVSETGEAIQFCSLSSDIQDDQILDGEICSYMQNHSDDNHDGEFVNMKDWNSSLSYDQIKYSRRKPKVRKDIQQDLNSRWSDRRRVGAGSESGVMLNKYESRHHSDSFDSLRSNSGFNKPLRSTAAKLNTKNVGPKFSEKFHCTNNRIGDRYDSHACSCNYQSEYRAKAESHIMRVTREPKYVNKSELTSDVVKPYYRGSKYNQVESPRESSARYKSKTTVGNCSGPHIKKVWEPMDSQKKYTRSNSDSDVTLRSTLKVEAAESDHRPESSGTSPDEVTQINHDNKDVQVLIKSGIETEKQRKNGYRFAKSLQYLKEAESEVEARSLQGNVDSSMSSSSNSDNCSSCLSEGDSNSSSNLQNPESSSTSDSEEMSQNSEGREISPCLENSCNGSHVVGKERKLSMVGDDGSKQTSDIAEIISSENLPKAAPIDNSRANISVGAQLQTALPPSHNQGLHIPMFQSPTVGYYHQSPVSWPAGPANGIMQFPHPNPYMFHSPFGYRLNGNARLMQYGTLQHLSQPLLNQTHLPGLPQVHHVNGINLKENVKTSNLGALKEVDNACNMQKVTRSLQHSMEVHNIAEAGQNGKSEKSDMGNTGFSLFHFGGPVALSTGYSSDAVSLQEGIAGNASANLSAEHPVGDHACAKKDSIEEYNLFANGIKFSIF